MNKPTEAETGSLMQCSCCGDDMVIEPNLMTHDDDLGYVCKDCRWNLRVADALLKECRMTGCQPRTK